MGSWVQRCDHECPKSDHGSDELTKLLVPETLAEAQVARWHCQCGSESSMEEIYPRPLAQIDNDRG